MKAHTATLVLELFQQMMGIDLAVGLLEALDDARDFHSRDMYSSFRSAWSLLGSFAIDDLSEYCEPHRAKATVVLLRYLEDIEFIQASKMGLGTELSARLGFFGL